MPVPYRPTPFSDAVRRLLKAVTWELPLPADYRPVAPLDLDPPDEARYAEVKKARGLKLESVGAEDFHP